MQLRILISMHLFMHGQMRDDDMNDVIAQGNSCVFKNQDYGRWANERTS